MKQSLGRGGGEGESLTVLNSTAGNEWYRQQNSLKKLCKPCEKYIEYSKLKEQWTLLVD